MTDTLPPSPTVDHLTTIFRRIAKGDIRIPALQRNLVWDEDQIISLLESIYKGFPIGSLLLWTVKSPLLRDAAYDYKIFLDTEITYPVNYVLDGMQRLSSLYGVFHYGERSDPRLNVHFDLDSGRFMHQSMLPPDSEASIPIRALMNPRELLDFQKTFLGETHVDRWMDGVIDLQARFQEYMVPIVTITREDVNSVVEIFDRINNTGTKLDTVDFMRAVTWSNDFDLNGRDLLISITVWNS
ncbi:DUF262 domain-containing protein [Aurantimonas sp. A2-1-M11]|uniref:DUF262 domain-containing protein n=1 Tax=Aurantimonas sp. A2-1-M11 TaxID=3113712 RepID=UPI002F95CE9B